MVDARSAAAQRSVLLKAIARLFSVQVAGLACGFLVHLGLARFLGVAEYGVYNFIFSIAMLVALIGNFGFQASSVRLIPQFQAEGLEKYITSFFKFSSLWVFVFSALFGALAFYCVSVFELNEAYTRSVLLSGVALTVLLALIKLNSGVLKGFKLGGWALAYESSLKEIIFLGLLGGFVVFGSLVLTAEISLWAVVTILTVLFLVSFTHIFKVMRPWKGCEDTKLIPYKDWLSISLPMMLVISAQIVIHRSDIVVLGFLSDVADVGAYSAGAKVAQAATLGMMVLNIIFSPRASEAFYQKDTARLKMLYFTTLKWQALSAVLLGAAIVFLAPFVLAFLGQGYGGALPVIYVLVGGYILNSLWGPVPFLMIMTRFEFQAMWFTFMAAALNIVLNLVLIPHYGILGAGIATVIALNLRNGFALFFIVKRGIFNEDLKQHG